MVRSIESLGGYFVHSSNQIVGCKLPSNRQVLSVLFFYMREVNLNLHQSAILVIQEAIIFWRKARNEVCIKIQINFT